MRALRAVLAELLGLFVDDGALALALLGCCGAVGAGLWLWPALPAGAAGLLLLGGCLAVLLVNVARAARPRQPSHSR